MEIIRWDFVPAYIVVVLVGLSVSAAAQDVVTIAGKTGGRMKVSGRIVDYTGRRLQLERPGGDIKSFPADKILRIETPYGPKQTDADALFAQDRFEEALTLYRQAMDDESRRWVRRQIIARAVWCYQALAQPERAGEAFLLLIRDDPDTPYFDCIPLAWTPQQPPVALEQAARAWLQREEPAAVLLGASHLISSSVRLTALKRLRELTAGSDRRIAQLAMAQTWRAAVATVTDEQLATWDRAIEQIPEALAAGPYHVLGRARLQRQQWQRAALALMRIPILYPQQRTLAAQSLLAAGEALEQLGRAREALGLYRELLDTYAKQTRLSAEAQSRIEAISKK